MSLMKLEEVRIQPYETTALPEGYEFASERRGRKNPVVSPWNWFARYNTPGHFIVHKLTTSPQGLTIDELKALVGTETTEVDKVLEIFRSGAARFAGWDLIVDSATKTRYQLIWRNPAEFYAVEQGLTVDPATVETYKAPLYVTQVPALIEAANKPAAPPKEKAVRAPREKKNAPASNAPTAPAGGYLAEYDKYGLRQEILTLINQFVDEKSSVTPKGAEAPINVRQAIADSIDKSGLEGSSVVEFIAFCQKESAIKAGLYRGLKELVKKYAGLKAQATPAPEAAA